MDRKGDVGRYENRDGERRNSRVGRELGRWKEKDIRDGGGVF